MTGLRSLWCRWSGVVAAMAMALAVLLALPAEARAQRFIRDAEIENIIRAYATPVFQAAGLNPQAIDVYLIEDSQLNAFVAGGMNMFINTGLLMKAEDPLEVIGVIAHETGHIAGGHIVNRMQEIDHFSTKAIAAYLLGLGAALVTGQPGLGVAIVSGGQDVALKGLLSYTRAQEQAADQAAIRYLTATGQSPRGMLDFMRTLSGQEMFLTSSQDPYLSTHPLTQERISFLEHEVGASPYKNQPVNPEFAAMHRRMRAKLVGFLEPLPRVFQLYPKDEQSLEARYAHAIAYSRRPDLAAALPLIDGLIAEHPNDPYFYELKGQILLEHGRAAQALPEYETAVRLLPRAPQLRMALAQVQLELNRPELDQAALEHVTATLEHEPQNAAAWRLAAIAYGRSGDQGMTSLALAESALARGQLDEARGQAGRAQRLLPAHTPSWLRAQDVERLAEQRAEKEKRR